MSPSHGHTHACANSFAEGFFSRKARRKVTDAAIRPAFTARFPSHQFAITEDFSGKALTVALKAGADAAYVANVSANAVNHQSTFGGIEALWMQRK